MHDFLRLIESIFVRQTEVKLSRDTLNNSSHHGVVKHATKRLFCDFMCVLVIIYVTSIVSRP